MFINLGAAGAVYDRSFTRMSGNYIEKKILQNLLHKFQPRHFREIYSISLGLNFEYNHCFT